MKIDEDLENNADDMLDEDPEEGMYGEPDDGEEEGTEESQSSSSRMESVQRARNVQKKAQTAKKAASTASKASKLSTMGPLAYAMMYILVALIIIIVVIGIIMFLITMPGMVMQKLNQLFEAIGTSFASYFGADKIELEIKEQDINDILDYLEDMGYDLKGDRFCNRIL